MLVRGNTNIGSVFAVRLPYPFMKTRNYHQAQAKSCECQLLAAKSWNSFPSLWASNFASVSQRKLSKKWCDRIRKQLVKALLSVNDCHASFYIILTSRWYICIELSFSHHSDPPWRSGFVHTAHWRDALQSIFCCWNNYFQSYPEY